MGRAIVIGSMRLQKEEQGAVLLIVLLFMLVSALAASSLVESYQTQIQREKEEQLLFVGEQFQRAIASYTYTMVGQVTRSPPSLEALIRDDRFPTPKQHLRKIYLDPMTGRADWVLVMGPGGIIGVHSRSEKVPFKASGFPERYLGFERKTSYADWVFSVPQR